MDDRTPPEGRGAWADAAPWFEGVNGERFDVVRGLGGLAAADVDDGDCVESPTVPLIDRAFIGDRLRATRTQKTLLSPIPGVFPARPCLMVLLGRTEVGKTSFAAWIAAR